MRILHIYSIIVLYMHMRIIYPNKLHAHSGELGQTQSKPDQSATLGLKAHAFARYTNKKTRDFAIPRYVLFYYTKPEIEKTIH